MSKNDTTSRTGSGSILHHAQAVSNCIRSIRSSRMPAGGWLNDIPTNENWRFATIVRRHRDQSAAP